MGIREGLRAFLLADSAIAALVAARVYPVTMAQGNRQTCIVYTRVSGEGDHHMQGASGLSRPRFQVDAWAADPDQAEALSDKVRKRIDGFRGMMGDVRVQGCFFLNERDDFDAEVGMYRSSRDYAIWHEAG